MGVLTVKVLVPKIKAAASAANASNAANSGQNGPLWNDPGQDVDVNKNRTHDLRNAFIASQLT